MASSESSSKQQQLKEVFKGVVDRCLCAFCNEAERHLLVLFCKERHSVCACCYKAIQKAYHSALKHSSGFEDDSDVDIYEDPDILAERKNNASRSSVPPPKCPLCRTEIDMSSEPFSSDVAFTADYLGFDIPKLAKELTRERFEDLTGKPEIQAFAFRGMTTTLVHWACKVNDMSFTALLEQLSSLEQIVDLHFENAKDILDSRWASVKRVISNSRSKIEKEREGMDKYVSAIATLAQVATQNKPLLFRAMESRRLMGERVASLLPKSDAFVSDRSKSLFENLTGLRDKRPFEPLPSDVFQTEKFRSDEIARMRAWPQSDIKENLRVEFRATRPLNDAEWVSSDNIAHVCEIPLEIKATYKGKPYLFDDPINESLDVTSPDIPHPLKVIRSSKRGAGLGDVISCMVRGIIPRMGQVLLELRLNSTKIAETRTYVTTSGFSIELRDTEEEKGGPFLGRIRSIDTLLCRASQDFVPMIHVARIKPDCESTPDNQRRPCTLNLQSGVVVPTKRDGQRFLKNTTFSKIPHAPAIVAFAISKCVTVDRQMRDSDETPSTPDDVCVRMADIDPDIRERAFLCLSSIVEGERVCGFQVNSHTGRAVMLIVSEKTNACSVADVNVCSDPLESSKVSATIQKYRMPVYGLNRKLPAIDPLFAQFFYSYSTGVCFVHRIGNRSVSVFNKLDCSPCLDLAYEVALHAGTAGVSGVSGVELEPVIEDNGDVVIRTIVLFSTVFGVLSLTIDTVHTEKQRNRSWKLHPLPVDASVFSDSQGCSPGLLSAFAIDRDSIWCAVVVSETRVRFISIKV